MGWWRIDPNTGEAAKDSESALSRPPDFVLLNAVPGVDDNASACYLGDGPWDMASTVPGEIAQATEGKYPLTHDQVRELLLRRVVPRHISMSRPDIGAKLLKIVDAFWSDIDTCYDDDWSRGALPPEKRWICEYVVEGLDR